MVERSYGNGGYGGGRRGGNNWNNNNNSGWGSGGNWDMNTIFSMKDISDKTRAHLQRVYTTLLGGVGACTAGMMVNQNFIVQGIMLTGLFFILMVYLMFQVHNRQNSEDSRIGYMLAAACALGFMCGPAMHHIAAV